MRRELSSFAVVMKSATCAFLLLGAGVHTAGAATVISVGTADLVQKSDFVFHGTVTEKWVAAGPKPGSIFTYLRYTVVDVLKGDGARRDVVLPFLGGTLDGRTLRVEGMRVPSVGEEGIFFVERLGRNQVHPLYGWDQGRFIVQMQASGKSVYTHDLKPVRRVEMRWSAPGISDGRAEGIETSQSDVDALTLVEFKERIRGIVEALQ